MASSALPFRSLKRTFVTPEGVDLQLELGSAGSRAGAFIIDFILMTIVLVVVTIAFLWMAVPGAQKLLVILWLIGFFVLRNGWFSLFEMGNRGATPGKRVMGLRVVARDGARLTGAAVIARNAMREIEVFLPLSFLGQQTAEGTADTFLVLFALLWSGIFLFFPLFNRDRLRVGDLVAGTWVVRTSMPKIGEDLVGSGSSAAADFPRRGARPLRHLRAPDPRAGPAQRAAGSDRDRRADDPRKGRAARRRRRLRLSVGLLRGVVRSARGGLLVGRRRESKFD